MSAITKSSLGIIIWLDLLSPHILPLCNELHECTGTKLYVICHKTRSEARKVLGWEFSSEVNYPIIIYDNSLPCHSLLDLIRECKVRVSIFQGIRCDSLYPRVRFTAERAGHLTFIYQEQLRLHSLDGLARFILYSLYLRFRIPASTCILAIGGLTNRRFMHLLKRYRNYQFSYFSSVVEALVRSPPKSFPMIRSDLSPVRLLYLGQFIKRKGLDILIDSLRHIPNVNLSLSICGSGPLLPMVLAAQSIDRRVAYITVVPMNMIRALLCEHHVVIAPSRYDGWGSVVVEAIAANKRVITTSRTGSSVLVKTNNSGIVIKSLSSRTLAQAISDEVLRFRSSLMQSNLSASVRVPTARKGAEHLLSCIQFANDYHGLSGPSNLVPDWLVPGSSSV